MSSTQVVPSTAQSCESDADRKCRWFNETLGNLTDQPCSLCLNRGAIAVVRNGQMAIKECSCMEHRRSLRRMKQSGLSDLLHECTFERFKVNTSWQQTLLEMTQNFLAQTDSGQWLYLGGQVGCGKTHLCTATAIELSKNGLSVRHMQWRSDIIPLKANVNDANTYAKLINPLKEAQVLYIDDFFKVESGKFPTPADVNVAFELLNYRYNQRDKVTILSGELTIDQIIAIDEAVGSRIYQKTKGFCGIVAKDPTKNYRLS